MGTRKFCPTCGKLTNVKVIPTSSETFFNSKDRNWWKSNEKVLGEQKIHYFARRLRCNNCNSKWTSVEFPLRNFNELMNEAARLAESSETLQAIADRAAVENEELNKTIEELNKTIKETFDSLVQAKQAKTELSELRLGLNVLKKNMFFTDLPSEVIKSAEELSFQTN